MSRDSVIEEDFDRKTALPLLFAASTKMMRQLMARNPGADFFDLYTRNHIELEQWIFVPLQMVPEETADVLAEVVGEVWRRHPRADRKRLVDRVMKRIVTAAARLPQAP
jgi:hypothetical protein